MSIILFQTIQQPAAHVRPLQLGEIYTQFALVDFFLVSL